jgi:hypothetical protein
MTGFALIGSIPPPCGPAGTSWLGGGYRMSIIIFVITLTFSARMS